MASSSAGTALSSNVGSLHIGDTVLFLIKTRDYKGYIYSELSSTPYSFLTVYNLEDRSVKEPKFSNISYAAFTVLAPNKFKAKQHLREVEQRKSEEYELLNARRAVLTEETENTLEQQRRFGSKVVYGDSIQLQHVATKRFIRVCSEASKTESNNLLVSLSNENFEECIFKILPRYKVRSEGDEVRFNDQLKIESVKNQGQFLHCSGIGHTLETAKINVLKDCFELNLSATESALTIIPHYTPSTSKYPDKALRAGNCVRLFHKEDECYIVAEGSFAEDNPVIEDVHCRMRRVDSRKHAAPSTSANTYWQIEKQEDPRSGEMIAWGDRCRLRHLPTRRYLAVIMSNDQWKVTLKEKLNNDDLETIFSFSPLIEEGEEVLMESYALIRHRLSGQWLHLEKKNHYIRHSFDPEAKGLAGLQWDSAELFMLTTSKDRGDYDSFTLQEVTEDLVDRFNYIAGIVPILSGYTKLLHTATELRQKQALRVRDTLRDLKKWLVTDKERDTKNNQKLLRNLRVLEQLAEILKFANIEPYEHSSRHTDICRECYNVIQKFLEGDSRKNENYLARFIEFFQTHMRKGLNAEEVLVEIVQDNLTIVSKMADTQMGHMIEQFVTTEDPRFLHFLSSLCVCANRPIPSTQNRLLEELVLKYGNEKFIRTKLDANKKQVYCYESNSPDKLTSLKDLRDRHAELGKRKSFYMAPSKKKNLYDLLVAQLHLLARLCQGNNKAAINALVYSEENTDGYISFNEALLCVQDSSIDTTIRSCYVQLILVMFVDVGDNRSFLDHLCYSFPYSELVAIPYSETGGSQLEALTGVTNIHFPAIKEWILTTLKSNTSLKCDSELNPFLESVLDVLGHLTRYGYYDDIEDVDEVMVPLIEMLDGTTDKPGSRKESVADFGSVGRKEDIPENKDVCAVKIKTLEVMELLYRFKFYVKLQKYMYDFKVLQTSEVKNNFEAAIDRLTTNNPPQALAQLMTTATNTSQDKQLWHSSDLMSIVRDRIKFLCDGNVRGGGFAPHNDSIPILETVLLDLSEYECDELVTASLDLLTQMYFFEEELFNKANQSQILTSPDSLRDYKVVKDEILPELRQLLRVDTNRENQDRIVYLLQTIQVLCFLPSSLQPCKQNQTMLDNFGVVSEIMNFVLEKGGHGTQDASSSTPGTSISVSEDLFRECLNLLRYIATENIGVQQRIFNRVDDLLDIKLPTSTLANLADLITEVFTGGPKLILKVSEFHVERIFEIIITCNNAKVQAQFLITLEAMMKIEEVDLPVSRNQAIIVKNLCRLRESFCPELLQETSQIEQKRMDILNSESHTEELELLLNVTDMLAACAEGKNLFIESVCQNIFSIEELVRIVSSRLPPKRKRPFVRFLIWAYMNTESDQVGGAQGTELAHGEIMWLYLEHLSSLLENVAKVLKHLTPGDMENIRQEFYASNRRRSSQISSPMINSTNRLPRLVSVGVPDVTDSQGQLIPGLLEYLADGVIPLLHTFYLHFFDPSSSHKDDQKEKEYLVSALIAKSLTVLSEELSSVFSSDKHIRMYMETINALMSHPEIYERANVTQEQTETMKTSSLKRLGTIDSQTGSEEIEENSSKILEQYKEQQKLNDLFNNYSRNYHYSYMGPNTASHQISSPVHEIEYSDEGEELPLGPSFQRLVKLYIDGDKNVKQTAERLLRQIEISVSRTEQLGEAEQVNQDKLDLRCLQLLRAIIHNRIKLIDPELKDRDPIQFRRKSDKLVVPIQNSIQMFGNAISRVIPLLSHPNESISREALALMKALLFSGNETVQEGLTIDMRETREEKLFLNLKRRLEIAGLNYKETVDLEAQLERRQQFKMKRQSTIHSLTNGMKKNISKQDPSASIVSYSASKSEVAIPMETFAGNDYQPLIGATSRNPPLEKTSKLVSFQSTDSDTSDYLKEQQEEGMILLSNLLAQDAIWTGLVLEVIGLMCDGQHRTLQHYLREQTDNFKTTNVVAEVVVFLHTYATDLTRDNLEQIGQILQALVEMCVGNIENQQVVFDKLLMDPLNRILQLPLEHNACTMNDDDNCPGCKRTLQLIQVKGSAVELLDVLLEEISSQTSTVANGIGSSLDVDAVLDTMNLFYELQSHPLVRRQQMDDDCQRSLSKAYHTLVTLTDYEAIDIKSKKELRKRGEKKCKEAFNAATQHSHAIEIHYEEEGSKPILAKVHFPCKETLREEVTELVRWNINRDSMEDKQRALVDLMPALKRDVRHQTRLKDTKIMKPFLAFHKLRSRLLLLLTIILNLFILFLFVVPEKNRENDKVFLPTIPHWFFILLFILGGIHLIMSLWIVVEYFVINWPHFRLPAFVYSLRAKLENTLRKDGSTYTVPHLTCIDVGIFSVSTLYMILFLFCSILSLAFRGYFYCFCLLFIIVDNDILKRVLRAVTKNGISLIWVAILGIIVLFIYAVLSFAFFQSNFLTDEQFYCGNLGQCMYSVLRYGFTDNLGFDIPFRNSSSTEVFDPRIFTARLIFGLSFFIIITTIGLNIVFGIIVDTFSELREERSNIEAEQKSKCFICDLPSFDFERRAKGFLYHIKHDHNMWDYIYYSLYLDSIDTGDHNAIQKYVYELIADNDTGFFPQEEARCLVGEEDTTGEKIDELQERVESILQHFRDREHKKLLSVKRQEQKEWEEQVLYRSQAGDIPRLSVVSSSSFDKH